MLIKHISLSIKHIVLFNKHLKGNDQVQVFLNVSREGYDYDVFNFVLY